MAQHCKVTYTFSFDVASEMDDKLLIVSNAMKEAAAMIYEGGKLSDERYGSHALGTVLVSYEASIRDVQ